MNALTSIAKVGLVYDHIVATGGIGSGIFFMLEGNETLGRNESRMGQLLPYKDYCKQHIILHYLSVLLGAKRGGTFQVYPIGKVGNDAVGISLLQQMQAVGMDTGPVSVCNDFPTLFSVCFQYPDHSGGNITSAQSASSQVLPEDVTAFFKSFRQTGNKEIVLAAPEVPVETRVKLLEYGRARGSLNVASVLSGEIEDFKKYNGFANVDILAVNLDEARHIAQVKNASEEKQVIIDACIESLKKLNAAITVLITCGSAGVYCYSKGQLEFTPSLNVPVVSTAGAGDAFLAGFITGICCGLPYTKGTNDTCFAATPLQSATEFGVLLASLSVMSPDTIHAGVNADALYDFIQEKKLNANMGVLKIFSQCQQYQVQNIRQ
jgi:sugar/nucleoside kinase (ribokinase family)